MLRVYRWEWRAGLSRASDERRAEQPRVTGSDSGPAGPPRQATQPCSLQGSPCQGLHVGGEAFPPSVSTPFSLGTA